MLLNVTIGGRRCISSRFTQSMAGQCGRRIISPLLSQHLTIISLLVGLRRSERSHQLSWKRQQKRESFQGRVPQKAVWSVAKLGITLGPARDKDSLRLCRLLWFMCGLSVGCLKTFVFCLFNWWYVWFKNLGHEPLSFD